MRPFSLYLHIPWCQAKCPYCDFNSYAASTWPEERYTEALQRELANAAAQDRWRGRRIHSIFFGGGTPSLFSPESIARVLREVESLWSPEPEIEITLEANPGTVTRDRLSGFAAAGINRLSFGVQSFVGRHLRALGRIHSGEDAVNALGWAVEAGFRRTNLDLIYALPGQTLAEWQSDLDAVCALGPEHVSAYNLTYEEGTAFHEWRARGQLQQQHEDDELAMFERAREVLGAAGYRQYEISNYARPGAECRHNLNYWRAGDYLGVGAGAHSFASGTAGQVGERWSNFKAPTRYLTAVESHGHAVETREPIDPERARGEFVFLNLRCRDGFPADAFVDRFGMPMEEAFPHSLGLREDGLLEENEGRWRLSPRGLVLADSVFATFV